MTFEEFKDACKEEIKEEMSFVDMSDESEYENIFGRVQGMIFAAKQFLPIRYAPEVDKLEKGLKHMARVARREATPKPETTA